MQEYRIALVTRTCLDHLAFSDFEAPDRATASILGRRWLRRNIIDAGTQLGALYSHNEDGKTASYVGQVWAV